MEYKIENDYVVFVDDEYNLLILLESKETEPKSPLILYDGGDHILFCRNPNETILLDYFDPELRKALHEAKSCSIQEAIKKKDKLNIYDEDSFDLTRLYEARYSVIEKLPLPEAFAKTKDSNLSIICPFLYFTAPSSIIWCPFFTLLPFVSISTIQKV